MEIEQVKINTTGIHISGGGKPQPFDSYCSTHLHTETEFIYVVAGKKTIIFKDCEFTINEGETVMIGRNIPHATSQNGNIPTSTILLQVNLEKFSGGDNAILQNMIGFLNENKHSHYVFKHDNPITKTINECILEILDEHSKNSPEKDFFITSNLYRLSGILHRDNILDDYFLNIDTKGLNRILPALTFIEKSFKQSITLDDISDTVHLNPEYLSRLFKKITGKNIFSYINYVRITNACKLLTKTDLPILDIALESGYSSISNFNRHFMKINNCTPTTYRKIKAEGIVKA